VGRVDFCEGEPSPDMPDTLCLLLDEFDIGGRAGIGGGALPFGG
jgi:hypothetical protein